jgi:hypothetical protein
MAGVFFVIAAAWYVLVLRRRIHSGDAGVPGERQVDETFAAAPAEAG